MTTTEREARYAQACGDPGATMKRLPGESISRWSARAVMAVADDEIAAVHAMADCELDSAKKARDTYKDAFKDATMANTVAAQKLAEQEAKTVEYRAAWIKATRERDEYRKLLREERDGRRILELEAGWVEADR